ncbi:hypothetical protein VP01_361g4 [Puccinia sorghi]|uniref:Uncharacterized protein n=1 Tax=Puccinia sorghi TaxID=27349 RepID=A0A0L6UUV2_9BASI|nr:hypothetical protein VP01_361g4 [Puccinia sorghi]
MRQREEKNEKKRIRKLAFYRCVEVLPDFSSFILLLIRLRAVSVWELEIADISAFSSLLIFSRLLLVSLLEAWRGGMGSANSIYICMKDSICFIINKKHTPNVKACSWRGGRFWGSGEWVFLSEYLREWKPLAHVTRGFKNTVKKTTTGQGLAHQHPVENAQWVHSGMLVGCGGTPVAHITALGTESSEGGQGTQWLLITTHHAKKKKIKHCLGPFVPSEAICAHCLHFCPRVKEKSPDAHFIAKSFNPKGLFMNGIVSVSSLSTSQNSSQQLRYKQLFLKLSSTGISLLADKASSPFWKFSMNCSPPPSMKMAVYFLPLKWPCLAYFTLGHSFTYHFHNFFSHPDQAIWYQLNWGKSEKDEVSNVDWTIPARVAAATFHPEFPIDAFFVLTIASR